MSECCFNHRYYIQVCVYSVYVLYVTLKEMNKIKLELLTADTHSILLSMSQTIQQWLLLIEPSSLLYKLSTLQNFNALLRNLHFQTNIDRMIFDYCLVSKII